MGGAVGGGSIRPSAAGNRGFIACRPPANAIADGRFVIAYNGEIYNARDVAADLPGRNWRGHSDTEVMLEACAAWGVEQAPQRFVGMFAFALWDRPSGRLRSCATGSASSRSIRRAGQRFPVRLGAEGAARASRPSAAISTAKRSRPICARLCAGAAHDLSRHLANCRRARSCTHALRAASRHRAASGRSRTVARAGRAEPLRVRRGADRRFDAAPADAVRRRMVADVPLGAFLSGGIDSSTVVALMQAQSRASRCKTFTIGFDEKQYRRSARMQPRWRAPRHRSHRADRLAGRSARRHSAPAGDVTTSHSRILRRSRPISSPQMTRRHVTVSLSGDGGDELFGGYTRYLAIDGMWRTTGMIPSPLRAVAGAALRAVPPGDFRCGEHARAGKPSPFTSRRQNSQGRRHSQPAVSRRDVCRSRVAVAATHR